MANKLNRRAFLAGTAATAVSLPLLEAMGKSAAAQTGHPPRFVVMYGGTSVHPDELIPARTGRGYGHTRGTCALAGRELPSEMPGGNYNAVLAPTLTYGNVRDDFSVVTRLLVPWAGDDDVPPPGGRRRAFHGSSGGPSLAGVASTTSRFQGQTADQFVADAFEGTTPIRSLNYRAQVKGYHGETGTGDRSSISYRGAGGRLRSQDPIVSPRVAFDSLVRRITPENPAAIAARMSQRLREQSILDNVLESANDLRRRLGSYDRRRLEQYLEEVRSLEESVRNIPEVSGGTCAAPDDPGADPAVNIRHCTEVERDDCHYTYVDGWAGEDLRAKALCDLIYTGFACDLTRVATLQLTFHQSHLNLTVPLGYTGDIHSHIGHGYPTRRAPGTADVVAWHLKYMAYLADRLRSTPEGDGTLLDNTVLVLLFEGGWGWDPSGGRNDNAHSTENMVAFVGGRAGGLRGGKHIATNDGHPASVMISAMDAVGVGDGTLGQVSGGIPELF